MSHWRHVKTDLKCPLTILQAAVQRIMQEFIRNIKMDVSKTEDVAEFTAINEWKQSMREGNDDIKGAFLKFKVGRCDVAFTKDSKGAWDAHYDTHEMPEQMKQGSGLLENRLKQEVAAMRVAEIARITGCTLKFNGKEGNKRVIRMLKPLPARQSPAKLYQQ